ncbi:MAG: ComF family protein [Rhodospirillales bacterium]|nr:ComF family protein [Rhodospirillales bacterium]
MRLLSPLAAALRRTIAVALDAVLPPQCLCCGAVVDASGALCSACWKAVEWIGTPQCAACGIPFEFDPGFNQADEALLCGACVRDPPPFARARAAFRYDDGSRALLLGFKHADRTFAAPAFGRWLARAGAELLAAADLVVPVPLHWSRLAWRRYNQAALLAHAVAQSAGRPCAPDLLIRRRRTPSQGNLGPAARQRNVRRAFRVHPRHRARTEGARILLIDDVFTTGATAAECTHTLLDAGAAAVDVLTLARVVRPVAE